MRPTLPTRRGRRSLRVHRLLCLGLVAAAGIAGCGGDHTAHISSVGETLPIPTAKQRIEAGMLHAARAGWFQPPPTGHRYVRPVECRIDTPHGFRGTDIYLCKIAISDLKLAYLWEWGAWQDNSLHLHSTDPQQIPTITGAFDPPW